MPAGALAKVGGASDQSRAPLVRALEEHSAVVGRARFEVPVEEYLRYLRAKLGAKVPPPVAYLVERGRYALSLDANDSPTLRAEITVRVLDPNRCAEVPVLTSELTWRDVTVDGKPGKLGDKGKRLILLPDRAGVFVVAARCVLGPNAAMPRQSAGKPGQSAWEPGQMRFDVVRGTETTVRFESNKAWQVSAGAAVRGYEGSAERGTHVSMRLRPTERVTIAWKKPVNMGPRPAQFAVGGAVAWNIDAGRQQISARMDVRLLGGPVDRMVVSLPADASQCKITGPDVRDVQVSGGRAEVFLRGKVSGQTRLSVAYELPAGAGGVKLLPAPRLEAGHWSPGAVVVVTNTAGASELVAGDVRGLREMYEGDVPAEARAILAGKVVLAYEVTARDFGASVEVLDLGEFALRESIADLAHYQVLLRPDGSVMCKVDYEIRNRTSQFLRVHMPEGFGAGGAVVLSSRVNDVPTAMMPAEDEKGVSLLPLVRSKASVKGLVSFPVQIVVLYRAAALKGRGLAELPLPTIDLPIAYGWCDLYAPQDMAVRGWSGAMRKVDQFSSETAVASLSYGSAELAEGYREQDRLHMVKAPPKPAEAPKKSRAGLGRWFTTLDGGEPTDRTRDLSPDKPAGKPMTTTAAGDHKQIDDAFKIPGAPATRQLATPIVSKPPVANRLFEKRVQVVDEKTVDQPVGGKLQMGAQSLLAGNYYRAGKDYYGKGKYDKAAESLGNVLRLAPGSVEADNAKRLLSNIDVVKGKAKSLSRQEKALSQQVQTEISGLNVKLDARQQELIGQATKGLREGRLDEAQAAYKAAESLGEQLIAQGANKQEQTSRMREVHHELGLLETRQKQQAGRLETQYERSKRMGDIEGAIAAGNALQRVTEDDSRKQTLRGELEELATKAGRSGGGGGSAGFVYGRGDPTGGQRAYGSMRAPDLGNTQTASGLAGGFRGRSQPRPGEATRTGAANQPAGRRVTRWGDEAQTSRDGAVLTGNSAGTAIININGSATANAGTLGTTATTPGLADFGVRNASPTDGGWARGQRIATLTRQAQALRMQQKYDQALEVVEEMLQLDPSNDWANREAGSLRGYLELGRRQADLLASDNKPQPDNDYDVRDLNPGVPNFQGPRIELQQASQASATAGGNVGGGGIFDTGTTGSNASRYSVRRYGSLAGAFAADLPQGGEEPGGGGAGCFNVSEPTQPAKAPTPTEELTENVIDNIRKGIDPESWADPTAGPTPGTPGTIKAVSSSLVIKQGRLAQQEIAELLAMLRRARAAKGHLAAVTTPLEPPVDAAARDGLTRQIKSIQFKGAKLADVITMLGEQSGVKVSVDWKALAAAGIKAKTKVSADLRDLPVRRVLDLVLRQASNAGAVAGPESELRWVIENGKVVVSTKAALDKDLVSRTYNVADLVAPPAGLAGPMTETRRAQRKAKGQAARHFIGMLRKMIDCESWVDPTAGPTPGTPGFIQVYNDTIVISQTPPNHRSLADLIHAIRAAKAQRDHLPAPEKRYPGDTEADAAARKLLETNIQRLSFDDVNLKDAIQFLREHSGGNLNVNWRALQQAGIEPTTTVSIDAHGITVADALRLLLRDVSSAGPAGEPESEVICMIDDGVVVVSTKADLCREPVRRVYDIDDLLDADAKERIRPDWKAEISQQRNLSWLLRRMIDPESWADPTAGPTPGTPGEVLFTNGLMVVAQTRENHRAVGDLIAKFRKDRLGKETPAGDPDEANVLKKLDRKIVELKFKDVALRDVLTFLREYSDVNIHVDWQAPKAVRIDPTTKISIDERNITVREALDLALDKASNATGIHPDRWSRLAWSIEGNVLIVSTQNELNAHPNIRAYNVADLLDALSQTPPAGQTMRRVYDVRELILAMAGTRSQTKAQAMGAFLQRVRRTIGPGSWAEPDELPSPQKPGTIEVMNGQLVVTQTPENHRALIALIEKFREDRQRRKHANIVTRTYDIRDLTVSPRGNQSAADLDERARDVASKTLAAIGGPGIRNAIRVQDGQLLVEADPASQRKAQELLGRLREIRGPQVDIGGNIAGQQAEGLVRANANEAPQIAGTFLGDIDTDFLVQAAAPKGTSVETAKAQFEDYIRRNYDWQLAGGGSAAANGPGVSNDPWTASTVANGTYVADREKLVKKLAEAAAFNAGQSVVLNSSNIRVTPADAARLGIRFVNGANNVRYATVDEAQLRTLRQMEAQAAAHAADVQANPRLQETIVGTDALLAGGQRAYVAHGGEDDNTLDIAGNPIDLPHEKYVLLDAGGYLTAAKAGAMQHWTKPVTKADVGFADVPQELNVPRVGKLVKFEKTLIKPSERLTIRAEYTFQGVEK